MRQREDHMDVAVWQQFVRRAASQRSRAWA